MDAGRLCHPTRLYVIPPVRACWLWGSPCALFRHLAVCSAVSGSGRSAGVTAAIIVDNPSSRGVSMAADSSGSNGVCASSGGGECIPLDNLASSSVGIGADMSDDAPGGADQTRLNEASPHSQSKLIGAWQRKKHERVEMIRRNPCADALEPPSTLAILGCLDKTSESSAIPNDPYARCQMAGMEGTPGQSLVRSKTAVPYVQSDQTSADARAVVSKCVISASQTHQYLLSLESSNVSPPLRT